MNKKKERRKLKLEVLAGEGKLFCNKHQDYLSIYMVQHKKCYLGRRNNYCKYVRIT